MNNRGRTPDYQLTEPHQDLPQGTFVRPIEFRWVHKDTREKLGIRDDFLFDEITQVVCYTSIGMIIIPREKIKIV